MTETMTEDAFYQRTAASTFVPSRLTGGPWDKGLQHGGPIAALMATAIDATGAQPGMRIAHFALEFLGPVPLAPMEVATEVVRPGKKIELVAAHVTIKGRPALRATAWRVATLRGRNPMVNQGQAPPAIPAAATTPRFPGLPEFGYGDALEWRFTKGGFDSLGEATAWTRMRVAVVKGEPVGALGHALAMVDSANGISAELDVRNYLFVPVNLTVSIARMPQGPWLGMSARTEISSEGAGTCHARLFDSQGDFGQALQTLYVEGRK